MIIQRRKFLLGLGAMFAAPAIVAYEHIMPVRAILFSGPWLDVIGLDGAIDRLRDPDEETVRKILAAQIVKVIS